MSTALKHPSLAEVWRERAQMLRDYGARESAATLEEAADDLEAWWEEWWHEPLSLKEAAEESPLAYGTLRRKVSEGEIPNAGRKHAPAVRRCDLPSIKTPEPSEPVVEHLEPEVVEEAVEAQAG